MSTDLLITTERLHLRPWRADDREPFAALNADPRVMELLPKILDRHESDALADRIVGHFTQDTLPSETRVEEGLGNENERLSQKDREEVDGNRRDDQLKESHD